MVVSLNYTLEFLPQELHPLHHKKTLFGVFLCLCISSAVREDDSFRRRECREGRIPRGSPPPASCLSSRPDEFSVVTMQEPRGARSCWRVRVRGDRNLV